MNRMASFVVISALISLGSADVMGAEPEQDQEEGDGHGGR